MLGQVVTHVEFHYALLLVAGLGMVMELLLGIRYSQLVRKTLDMGKREQVFTEQFKKSFKVDYQLGLNVNNVDNFVDNYVYKQKFMGIFLYTWEKLCGQVKIMSGFLTILSVFFLFYFGCGKNVVINELVTILVLCTMWITIVLLSGLGAKRKELHNNLSEYLENTFIPRLKRETENPEQFSKLCRELALKQADRKIVKQAKKEGQEKREKKKAIKNGREKIEREKQELIEELQEEREVRKQEMQMQKSQNEEKDRSRQSEKRRKPQSNERKKKICGTMQAEQKMEPVENRREAEEENRKEENISFQNAPEKNEKILQDILREYLGG